MRKGTGSAPAGPHDPAATPRSGACPLSQQPGDPPGSSAATAPSAPTDTAPADTPTTGLYCARCDYDLRGHALTDLCPECGTPVHLALPPPGFRFGNLATARRMLRGLSILLIAVAVYALAYLGCWIIWRYYMSVPRWLFRIGRYVFLDGYLVFQLLRALGVGVACWTFGQRGDRRLRALGGVVMSLVALPVVPACVDRLWPASSAVFSPVSSVTYVFIDLAADPGMMLFCVLLLLRTRLRQNRPLCVLLLLTLATTAANLALSIWSTVDSYQRWECDGSGRWVFVGDEVPSLLAWCQREWGRVDACVKLVFALALWLYFRALRAAVHRRVTPGVPPAPA